MRNPLRIAAPLALLLAFAAGATPRVSHAGEAQKHYVCPRCNLTCDATVFDKPGVCPQCGMALVEQGSAAAAAHAKKAVGILIFNGVEIIDYTGPWEVFGAAEFDVYTVAASRDPVTTAMGMTVVPKYTFADAPQSDVLVVPGGGVKAASGDRATLAWVNAVTEHAQHTMSVCNGAFILAHAGLLDGLGATTTASNLDRLEETFPKIRVVYDQRFVDNGKIITTGGLSAGIDGALHVVEKMLGHGTAQQVALSEEYDWQAQSSFARAALADRLIPDFHEADLAASGEWQILHTEGGRDRWDIVFQGPSKLNPRELFAKIAGILMTRGRWTRVDARAGASPAPTTGMWKVRGRDGREWRGTMSVTAESDGSNLNVVKIHIARAG